MGFVSELLGEKKNYKMLVGSSVPDQVSVKATPGTEDLPEDKYELERAYKKDPIVFNSINKSVQMIMAAKYTVQSENKATSDYFNDFFDSIGNVGEDLTSDELIEAIFKYQMLYGESFVELVFNKKMDRIVDLALFDPKRMDYAKSSDKKIALDQFGKPIGYTLKLPYGVKGKSDKIPDKYENKISLESEQIFILPQRVCHFKLYAIGDRFYGIGLVEPSYKSIVRKMNIEEAQTNSIYTRGTYPLIAYVGDQMHEPTPQVIQEVLNNLVKLKHDRFTAFQYFVKVEPLEVKHSDIVDKTLEYLRLNQTASLGMPMAFATGSGEKTNRATLNNQQQFLEYTLNDIVNKTIATFRKYIFKRICFYNKVGPDIPALKWGDIRAEEPNEKAARLMSYVQNGVLLPQEIKEFVKNLEGL